MKNVKNQVQLIGRLGKNPILKKTKSGKMKTNISIAVNQNYVNEIGQKIENTQWFNIVAWDKTAELMERLLETGNEILVQGKLTQRVYTDKDGKSNFITEIIADHFLILNNVKVMAS